MFTLESLWSQYFVFVTIPKKQKFHLPIQSPSPPIPYYSIPPLRRTHHHQDSYHVDRNFLPHKNCFDKITFSSLLVRVNLKILLHFSSDTTIEMVHKRVKIVTEKQSTRSKPAKNTRKILVSSKKKKKHSVFPSQIVHCF